MIFSTLTEKGIKKEYRKETVRTIITRIVNLIKQFFITIIKNLVNGWNKLYNSLYCHKKVLLIASLLVLLAIEFYFLIPLAVSIYESNVIDYDLIKNSLIVAAIYLCIYIFCLTYHKLSGIYSVLYVNRLYFIEFVHNILSHIGKIHGRTGAGKDTLLSAFDKILSDKHYQDILQLMKKSSTIAYMVDYDKLQTIIENDESLFKSCSDELNERDLLLIMKRTCIIKKRYRKMFPPQDLVDDYFNYKEHKAFYDSKFIFNVHTTQTHFFTLIQAYCISYKRLVYAPVFSMANQPLKCDNEIMAKRFSYNYVRLVADSIYDKDTRTNYKSKTLFPWVDHLTITETEGDSWYINVDSGGSNNTAKTGTRDFRAYIRHLLGENTYWFSTGQDAGRMQKLLRELDHCYIEILQKKEIDGGLKRRLIAEPIYNAIEYLINSCVKTRARKNAKIDRKRELARKYRLLYLASSKIKYAQKYESLIKLKNVNSSSFEEWLVRRRKALKQKIDTWKNEGYIKLAVIVSDKPEAVNCEQIPITKVVNDERPLYKRSYMTEFVFLKTDSWGRYDTHYLKSLKEKFAKESEQTFYDIDSWSESMTLTEADVVASGYSRLNKFFGIDDAKKLSSGMYEEVE